MQTLIDEFHDCFDQVDDPRVQGRIVYLLNSILFLVVAAVIADCDGPKEIEELGNDRVGWLSRFADFANGIPSHDTIGRVLSLIKPDEFQTALLTWHQQLCQHDHDETNDQPLHVALNGKTARGPSVP